MAQTGIFAIFGFVIIALIIIITVLIVKRVQDKDNETFDKRDF